MTLEAKIDLILKTLETLLSKQQAEDEWLTLRQASERSKRHPATLREWIRSGRLRATADEPGKHYRVKVADLEEAMKPARRVAPSPEEIVAQQWSKRRA